MVQLALKYQDEDDLLEYQNTCVAEFKDHIVVYRAPVLGEDQRGLEEKSPIHVADVVRMMGGYRVGRAVPHIVSTGDVPRLRSVVGGAVPQQKRRSGSEQIRRCSWTTWITVKHHGCLEWEDECPT